MPPRCWRIAFPRRSRWAPECSSWRWSSCWLSSFRRGRLEHLDDNLAAADLQLTTEDLREIDEAFTQIEVRGAPLSAALESQIDR